MRYPRAHVGQGARSHHSADRGRCQRRLRRSPTNWLTGGGADRRAGLRGRSEVAGAPARLDVGPGDRHLRRLARARVDVEPQPHLGVGSAGQARAVVGRARARRQLEHDSRHVRRSQRLRVDERAREQPHGEVHARPARSRWSIGKYNETGGSNDTTLMGRPSEIWVDPADNEVFVADGYGNRRIIVFDGATGKYLRHWGAYGKRPEDPRDGAEPARRARRAVATPDGAARTRRWPRAAPGARTRCRAEPPQQFSVPHGIVGSRDGLIYLADRANNRIQVFRQNGEFVAEDPAAALRRAGAGDWTPKRPCGIEAAFSVGFSHDVPQTYLYIADGGTHVITVLRRQDLEVVERVRRTGRRTRSARPAAQPVGGSVGQHLRRRGGRSDREASDDRRRSRGRLPRAEVHVQGRDPQRMTLADLNASDRDGFVAAVGWIFEHSPWVAERAWAAGRSRRSTSCTRRWSPKSQAARADEQLALLRAHPDLGAARPHERRVDRRAGRRRARSADAATSSSGCSS